MKIRFDRSELKNDVAAGIVLRALERQRGWMSLPAEFGAQLQAIKLEGRDVDDFGTGLEERAADTRIISEELRQLMSEIGGCKAVFIAKTLRYVWILGGPKDASVDYAWLEFDRFFVSASALADLLT